MGESSFNGILYDFFVEKEDVLNICDYLLLQDNINQSLDLLNKRLLCF